MQRIYPVMNGNEPAITQPPMNGWDISWNPDDNRWYVCGNDAVTVATFKERRNAMQYARTHNPR
jgi:hypothetical protein